MARNWRLLSVFGLLLAALGCGRGAAAPTASPTPAASSTVVPSPVPATASTVPPTGTPTPSQTPAPSATPALAAPAPPTTRAVVLVVIDGARWTETLGDPAGTYVPHLAYDLAPLGAVNTAFYNEATTLSWPGYAAIVTGSWQDIAPTGRVRPALPTLFEYYRKATGAPASDAVLVDAHGEFLEPPITYSTHPDYGADFGAQLFFPPNQAPFDEGLWPLASQALADLHPHLLMLDLISTDDAAHTGDWDAYTAALQRADEIIWALWQQLQADPFYAGQTTLIVTNDHGRHCGAGWSEHGGADVCNRQVMFLAVGPEIPPDLVVDQRRTQRDITPTIGHLLGFDTPLAEGDVMHELFED